MKTKTTRPTAPMKPRRGVVLPDDACPYCGAMTRPSRAPIRFPINGEMLSVPHVPHLECPKCHESMLDLAQTRLLTEGAVALYRRRHQLLSGEEIREIRERFSVSQALLGRLLGLGPNTLSRWESGRHAQTAAMDRLLRLLRDFPGAFEFLRANYAHAS